MNPPTLLNLAFWMPGRASESAADVDRLFSFIMGLTIFFVILIVGLLVTFVLRYRHRPGHESKPAPNHNHALEIIWTLIPTILVVIIFFWGFRTYLKMAVPPPHAYEIQVTGRMWNWSFMYPNGHTDSELHVPIDTPVQLILSSADVIHSLYIPAIRLKKDVVPGRFNKLWFQANQLGSFDIYCASYCGTNHSQMLTKLVVHDADGFKKWLAEAGNWETRMTPVEAGRMFYEKRSCNQCHSIDGTRIIGPSFKNLFGSEQRFTDGTSAIVDENLIRQFLFEPQKQIPAGYEPQMPSFKGSLQDKDILAIVAYIKSLSGYATPATAPTTQNTK